MTSEYRFTEEDLVELIGDDLTLPASLATLINNGGDIRSFLVEKLLAREEELAIFHLSQEPRWMDEHEFKESLGIARRLGLY